jgi:AP-3 complex subunit delta
MLGYDMGWAAFNVVEVMSQEIFTAKRIGYLAASVSFDEGTEVTMLATNLIKKVYRQ